ncbi:MULTISPECIES: cold-shock protein [Empedobacter]|uniref:Cold shock domain-containing protein n=1 Tax=Empedobacter falsenii TaxID=343874 RepID=A0A427BDK6_9FLAO|nr:MULTISPECIES: cold shock domain-containing protein [Empedobacter]MDH1604075.1 cold shock domain-containing protein [Empedobacter sp. GD03739]RRT86314.1 cold shock domain-containing protein [Empedobacter falsenii]RRT87012.1 cold shock domain-containing protein [Empedobacter falsenii]
MADSTSKKEKIKKKELKRKEKINKRELRKTDNNKGKSLEELLVYVDVLGNLTDVPPHLQDKEKDLLNHKKENDRELIFNGIVDNYNVNKGFGFIKVLESSSNEKVFFHFKESKDTLTVGDNVQFKKSFSEKGFRATNIIKM